MSEQQQQQLLPPREVVRLEHKPFPQHFLVRPGSIKHSASGTIQIPGPIIPLIALDQLPDWLDILDVPRELSREQADGLLNVGTVSRNPQAYEVYIHRSLNKVESAAAPVAREGPKARQQRHLESSSIPDKASMTAMSTAPLKSSSGIINPAAKPFISARQPTSRYHGENHTSGVIDKRQEESISTARRSPIGSEDSICGSESSGTITSATVHRHPSAPADPRAPSPPAQNHARTTNPYPAIHPSAALPGHGHTQPPPTMPHPAEHLLRAGYGAPASLHPATDHPRYGHRNGTSSNVCKHFCHHGKCKWGSECRYEHAMPTTRDGLREVGLNDYPGWWKTHMKLMAEERAAASNHGQNDALAAMHHHLNHPLNHPGIVSYLPFYWQHGGGGDGGGWQEGGGGAGG
ncbi:hypothetical protein F4780DRAFT_282290 [Xylariomycetidae sp. FL0641]|nr:hypothetical protein F4780DRAFT_282290 [Xylariomycetidae sp. FL0641]